MHDALGSVTGTTDGSGNLQNTYRWAGYGTQVAKTGGAPDPYYLWVGTWGYRRTGRSHSGTYVRARHYGVEQAAWAAVDEFWLTYGRYAYSRGRVVTELDPSGLQPTLFTTCTAQKLGSPCGSGAALDWLFTLDGVPQGGGWLVQEITITRRGKCCSNPTQSKLPSLACNLPCLTYYEAFWVPANGHAWVPKADCGSGWQPPTMGSNGNLYDDYWNFGAQDCIMGAFADYSGTQYWSDKQPFAGCAVCGSGALPSTCNYAPSSLSLGTTEGNYKSTCCYKCGDDYCTNAGACPLPPADSECTCNTGELCWFVGETFCVGGGT